MMKQRTKLIMVFLLGVAILLGGIAVYYLTNNSAPPPVFRLPILLGIIVSVSLLIAIVAMTKLVRRHSGRRLTLEDTAANLNLRLHEKPDKNFHRPFADMNVVKRSGATRKLLTGEFEGRPLTIFQHTYMVYTGQATIPVSHTVYATPTPGLGPGWPEVRILRRHWMFRLWEWLGRGRSLKLENPDFNRAFRVVVAEEDEDFAVMLLSLEMQSFMLEKPGVSWVIDRQISEYSGDSEIDSEVRNGKSGVNSGGGSGGGWVCLVYPGPLKPDRMNASLNRLRRFWELVPEELEGWVPAD